MPTLMTGESRGGSGIAEDDIIVDFDEPDWDVAAARLVQESKDGDVGGISEPEVIGSRGFVPKILGGESIRATMMFGSVPYLGNLAVGRKSLAVQRFRKTDGGWEAFQM